MILMVLDIIYSLAFVANLLFSLGSLELETAEQKRSKLTLEIVELIYKKIK